MCRCHPTGMPLYGDCWAIPIYRDNNFSKNYTLLCFQCLPLHISVYSCYNNVESCLASAVCDIILLSKFYCNVT